MTYRENWKQSIRPALDKFMPQMGRKGVELKTGVLACNFTHKISVWKRYGSKSVRKSYGSDRAAKITMLLEVRLSSI
ncbi:MAG: hypothetical protein Q9P01_13450 [Anaerolineae bacterium]|nr:hypothetical protein [Anaerolineae bacterium]